MGYWLDFYKTFYPFVPLLLVQVALFFLASFLLVNYERLSSKRGYGAAVLLLSVGVFLVWVAIFYDYTVDDAYIFLRYARNLGHGAGLTFNLDDSRPVEGYTSFLWTLVLTIPYSLRFADPVPLHFAKVIGILFGIGLIFVTTHLSARILGARVAGYIAALLTSTIPFLAFWSVGGLETSLYLFLNLLAIDVYVLEVKAARRPALSAATLFLAILARPESLLLAVALYVQYVFRETPNRGLRSALRDVRMASFLLGALLALYTVWRYRTYGLLLPNTFYAKKMSVNVYALLRRLYELSPFVVWSLPFIAVGWARLFVPSRGGSQKSLLVAPLLTALVIPFAAYREWMPGYRYELLLLPLLFVLVSDGVSELILSFRMADWRQSLPACTMFLFLYVYLFFPHYPGTERLIIHRNSVVPGMVSSMGSSNPWHPRMGLWLKKWAPEDASLAAWDVGALPYFSELPVVFDIHQEGLLDSHTTHQGYSVEYFLDQQPTFIFLQPLEQVERSKGVMLGFYNSSKFMTEYEPLFSTGRETLYVRKEANFSQEALTKAERLFPISSQ